ncbi:hypothetical protein RCH07_002128 [Arthrobacter sp. CG_A4]|nr:hypothetical protein [Arthrobacter sp. CG_A4]
MKTLETTGALFRHPFYGEWNYTLHPIQNHTPEPC